MSSTEVKTLVTEIQNGNRIALGKAITLTESTLPEHSEQAQQLQEQLLPRTGNSLRIGITGVPGVGKSTFIDAFGMYLCNLGKKVAVLAVDPSSTLSKGSILGDKTRMENLSRHANAFIRPSPSGSSLGGVNQTTRETILLCEAAGFDIIIVETVGVGQSETAVKNMTDFFLLLMLAGAGDELQGMKRGIMEMADALLINKVDGDNIEKAQRAAQQYRMALHLFQPAQNEWLPKVDVCSALMKTGIDTCWNMITEFEQQQKANHYFERNRQQQQLIAFRETLEQNILRKFFQQPDMSVRIQQIEKQITENAISPYKAAQEILKG
jgi:LAO/AO transport system kinase